MKIYLCEQTPEDSNRRLGFTRQHGLLGWLRLAMIAAVGPALIAVIAWTRGFAADPTQGALPAAEAVVCVASTSASGASGQATVPNDSRRQAGL
ncbi:hypothetical protein BH11PSE9_BH11PSE9_11620 [soil metagenome]